MTKLGRKIVRKRIPISYAEERGIPTVVAKRLDGSTFNMPHGKEVGLGPGHIVLDGDPVGTQPLTAVPLHFRPMPVVAKWSSISATPELLWRNAIYFIYGLSSGACRTE